MDLVKLAVESRAKGKCRAVLLTGISLYSMYCVNFWSSLLSMGKINKKSFKFCGPVLHIQVWSVMTVTSRYILERSIVAGTQVGDG